jgi:hypothetical protein
MKIARLASSRLQVSRAEWQRQRPLPAGPPKKRFPTDRVGRPTGNAYCPQLTFAVQTDDAGRTAGQALHADGGRGGLKRFEQPWFFKAFLCKKTGPEKSAWKKFL